MENSQLFVPDIGTPQGSIVSPLFANIYLHELDTLMDQLAEIGKGEKQPNVRTPFAKKIRNQIRSQEVRVKKMSMGPNRDREIKKLKSLKMQSIRSRSYIDSARRLCYHRYANDFIIGIAGSREFVDEIQEKVKIKLAQLNLELSSDKTKVTFLKKEKARFLGYDISIGVSRKIRKVHPKRKKPFLKATTGWFVHLEAPMPSIIARLFTKDFCRKDGFPTPKKIWAVMPDYQIVDAYNVSLAGILQYYSGACHRNKLRRLMYIFRYSCAMTIATKHRSSIHKVFKRHGKSLKIVYGMDGQKSIEFKEFDVFRERDKKWKAKYCPILTKI